MRAFTERSQPEWKTREREGGLEGRRKGGGSTASYRESEREGGGAITLSFQAVEVEREEKRKISCCFKKERRDRERVWITELLNFCVFFSSPPLSCTDS